jgi:hypothetical protein
LGGLVVVSAAFADADDERQDRAGGALFIMTNSVDSVRGNEIVMYDRAPNGDLSLVGYFPTGHLSDLDPQRVGPQRGSGPAPTAQIFNLATDGILPLVSAQPDGLGSSNSLILSRDNRCLFAVNAGDNTVSSFRVRRNGLRLMSVVDSRGVFPVSLTEHRDILYVLNSGEDGKLAGFRVRNNCGLTPLDDGTVDLTGLSDSFPTPEPGEVLTTPAQASFTPDGKRLVLSIKGLEGAAFDDDGNLLALPNGRMAVFPVESDGLLGQPVVTPFSFADGTGGPFSFVFDDPHTVIVVHANSGTIASFTINPDHTLSLRRGADPLLIPDREQSPGSAFAPCWVAKAGRFVYAVSFGAPSGVLQILGQGTGKTDLNGMITGFRIRRNGTLRDLGVRVEYPAPGEDRSGNHGIDLHVIDSYLYFIQPRTGMVGRLTINHDGSLTDLVNFGGLAPGLEPFPLLNPGINVFLKRCFLQDPDPETLSPECRLGSAQGITGF